MVVPFPPGPLDLIARLVGGKVGDALGQTVVIENRAGANGTIGSNMVARAAPDGYTLLAATAGTHVTAVHLLKSLPYDPIKDFTPLAAAVEPVTCLVVHAALPVNSVPELIDYAKRRPGELAYGTSGVGSVFHMMGELFNQTAGVKINHVPYRGVALAMQDVAGGHIPMTFISIANALPAVQDGRAKILAVLEPARYREAAANPFDVRDHPGLSQAVVLVRLPRPACAAAADRGAPQRRDGEGAQRARRARQARGQRLYGDRRPAGAAGGADGRRHRALRRHHQGRRHPAGVR